MRSQKKSAGILLYRFNKKQLELLLVHPGGPFWVKKDEGAWTIPKGELNDKEDALLAAKREFEEETGLKPEGDFIKLSPVKQKAGKLIYAWAVQGNIDITQLNSNTFEMEWPPRSGKRKTFPEVDKAAWFTPAAARSKMVEGQLPLIEEIQKLLEV